MHHGEEKKEAKLDVEDGFQPSSSKYKFTLWLYLLRYIKSRFDNNPSSDGTGPEN